MSKFVNLGALLKSKDGGVYIKLDKDVKLTINDKEYNNQYFSLNKPEVKYERMLSKNTITEEEATSKIESIPDYVKYEITAMFKD